MEQPQELGPAVGQQLVRIRKNYEITQEEVARQGRQLGFVWRRSWIAALETGSRKLSLAEVIGLLFALRRCADNQRPELADLELANLIPNEKVRLSPQCTMEGSAVAAVLSGKAGAVRILGQDKNAWVPASRPVRIPKRAASRIAKANPEAAYSAENVKAARRFSVTPTEVESAAVKLWEHSLAEERDERLIDLLPEKPEPRTVQAYRGQVTKRLYTELAPLLSKPRAARP